MRFDGSDAVFVARRRVEDLYRFDVAATGIVSRYASSKRF
jgi:hypothetical protein